MIVININSVITGATSGVHLDGNNIKLGGTLTEATTINTSGNGLTFAQASSHNTIFGDDGSLKMGIGSNYRFSYAKAAYNAGAAIIISALGTVVTPTATLHVRGSANDSYFTAKFEQADGSKIMTWQDGGVISMGNSGSISFYTFSTNIPDINGDNLAFDSRATTSTPTGGTYRFGGSLSFSGTSGNQYVVGITKGFAPTSGTATFSSLNLAPTINQTGSATGISRTIFSNPTLTSAYNYQAFSFTLGSAYTPNAAVTTYSFTDISPNINASVNNQTISGLNITLSGSNGAFTGVKRNALILSGGNISVENGRYISATGGTANAGLRLLTDTAVFYNNSANAYVTFDHAASRLDMAAAAALRVGSLSGTNTRITGSSSDGTQTIVTGTGFLKLTGSVVSFDTSSYTVNPMTTQGDIIYGGVAAVPTRLPIGTTGYILQSSGTAPQWFNLFGTANTWTATQAMSINVVGDGTVLTLSNANASGGSFLRILRSATERAAGVSFNDQFYVGVLRNAGSGTNRFGISSTSDLATAGGADLVIANGTVGLYTNNPATGVRFTINGNSVDRSPAIYFQQSGTNIFRLGTISATSLTDVELWNSAAGYLRLGTNNQEWFRIVSTGEVGIGGVAAAAIVAPLTLQANASTIGMNIIGRASDNTSRVTFKATNGTTTLGLIQADNTGLNLGATASNTTVFNISTTHLVGIGKVADTGALLDINGATKTLYTNGFYLTNGTTERSRWYDNGSGNIIINRISPTGFKIQQANTDQFEITTAGNFVMTHTSGLRLFQYTNGTTVSLTGQGTLATLVSYNAINTTSTGGSQFALSNDATNLSVTLTAYNTAYAGSLGAKSLADIAVLGFVKEGIISYTNGLSIYNSGGTEIVSFSNAGLTTIKGDLYSNNGVWQQFLSGSTQSWLLHEHSTRSIFEQHGTNSTTGETYSTWYAGGASVQLEVFGSAHSTNAVQLVYPSTSLWSSDSTINWNAGTVAASGKTFNIYIDKTKISTWSINRLEMFKPFKAANIAADPGTAENGDIYYNTTTNKFRGYENGAWANLI